MSIKLAVVTAGLALGAYLVANVLILAAEVAIIILGY